MAIIGALQCNTPKIPLKVNAMKAAMLIIVFLANESWQIESSYFMPTLDDCEKVAHHQAVVTSYPDRVLLCRELLTFMSASETPPALSSPVPPRD